MESKQANECKLYGNLLGESRHLSKQEIYEQAGNSGLWFSCHGGYGKFITTPKDLKSWRTNYVLGPRLGKALSNVLIPT